MRTRIEVIDFCLCYSQRIVDCLVYIIALYLNRGGKEK